MKTNKTNFNFFNITRLKEIITICLLLIQPLLIGRDLSKMKEIEFNQAYVSVNEVIDAVGLAIDTIIVEYDIIIENGKIIDGTGNPWYYGDIGVVGDKISKIGNLKESPAKRRVDASGMFISPGFIDMHTHSDRSILNVPTSDNFVRQGITTTVAGNCGSSRLPVVEFLDKVNEAKKSINFITLVGHSSIRRQIMGQENRDPTMFELSEMQRIISESMEAGAFGISTGLFYTPANYANTEEIIELAKIVASYGGIYASHIRDEGIGLIDAINEAITIGGEAGLPVQISHIKCSGKQAWYKSNEVLDIIKKGREEGIDVLFDQYPYTASMTHIWGTLFPSWAREGGTSGFFERLEDKDAKEKIKIEIQENIKNRGGGKALYVIKEQSYLSDLAAKWKMSETDAAIQIQRNGGSNTVSFSIIDKDLENFIVSPYGMIGSDGELGSGHPRSCGTFPRVLGVYVREKNLLTWEEAIRKMTSAPANRLGLWERGIVREGLIADIVVFNPEIVIDKATYENPSTYPEGIIYVLVNGEIVIDSGEHTNAFPGKVLFHRSRK